LVRPYMPVALGFDVVREHTMVAPTCPSVGKAANPGAVAKVS